MLPHLLNLKRIIRNSGRNGSWDDLDAALAAALQLAAELGLTEAQRVLQATLYRGRKLLEACDDPVSVLLVSTQKLPNHQGVDADTLLGDLQELKLVRKIYGRHHHHTQAGRSAPKQCLAPAGGGVPFPSAYYRAVHLLAPPGGGRRFGACDSPVVQEEGGRGEQERVRATGCGASEGPAPAPVGPRAGGNQRLQPAIARRSTAAPADRRCFAVY